jgi:hypothetical protein
MGSKDTKQPKSNGEVRKETNKLKSDPNPSTQIMKNSDFQKRNGLKGVLYIYGQLDYLAQFQLIK